MVVQGITEGGMIYVTNKELMLEFEKVLADEYLDIRKRGKAFIVELKKDEKVDIALAQIKEKEYVQKFKSENNEVLAVAICYDSKTKKHSCKIERIQ